MCSRVLNLSDFLLLLFLQCEKLLFLRPQGLLEFFDPI